MFRDDDSESISSINSKSSNSSKVSIKERCATKNEKEKNALSKSQNSSITTVSLSSNDQSFSQAAKDKVKVNNVNNNDHDLHKNNLSSKINKNLNINSNHIINKSIEDLSSSLSSAEIKTSKQVVNDIINSSLQETTDLLELLTVEERHKRKQFEKNIISVENSPRITTPRVHLIQQSSSQENSLIQQTHGSVGSFPNSNRPKSAHPKSVQAISRRAVNFKKGSSSVRPGRRLSSGSEGSRSRSNSNSRSRSKEGNKSSRPSTRRRRSTSNDKKSGKTPKQKSIKGSSKHLPILGKSNERIEKLYNTQKYIESHNNYQNQQYHHNQHHNHHPNLSPNQFYHSQNTQNQKDTKARLDKLERSSAYDDNDSVRRAVEGKSSRPTSATGSKLSKGSSIFRPLVNRPRTAIGSKLITQNLKHPVKNKNFSFTETRMREIQKENMRLYKNLLSINRPRTNTDNNQNNNMKNVNRNGNFRDHKEQQSVCTTDGCQVSVGSDRKKVRNNAHDAHPHLDLDSTLEGSASGMNMLGQIANGGVGLGSSFKDDASEASTLRDQNVSQKIARVRPKSAKVDRMGGGDSSEVKQLAPSSSPTKKRLKNRPDSAASTLSKMSSKSGRSIKSNRSVKSQMSILSNMSNTSLRSTSSGYFYPTPAAKLNREREQVRIDRDNYRIYERLKNVRPTLQTRY